MKKIYKDLYMFSTYVPQIDLTFNQFLLLTDEPVLIHTGDNRQAEMLVGELKGILGERKLKYVFGAHFEADEYGGLLTILKEYPEAVAVCSSVCARQLGGFGISKNVIVKKPGETLSVGNGELQFFNYPSEMHLWDGLLVAETTRKIFFSSDLMIRFGKPADEFLKRTWKDEVEGIACQQILDTKRRRELKGVLKGLDINFVATGHGQCIEIIGNGEETKKEGRVGIPDKMIDVLNHEGVVAIVTFDGEKPHVVNTWNSYIYVTEEQSMLVPAGRMRITQENMEKDNRVLLTLGSREVDGFRSKGTGFLIEAAGEFLDRGKDYDIMKERFPWMRSALRLIPENITQTL